MLSSEAYNAAITKQFKELGVDLFERKPELKAAIKEGFEKQAGIVKDMTPDQKVEHLSSNKAKVEAAVEKAKAPEEAAPEQSLAQKLRSESRPIAEVAAKEKRQGSQDKELDIVLEELGLKDAGKTAD